MSAHYNRANIMTMVETTRQRLGFKKGDMFEPTPNVRNPHMLEEAEAFSPQLRSFEHAVRDYHRHVQGFLGSLIPLLEENLPRVWTAVSGGLAEPVRPSISHGHPSRIGGDFNATLVLERLELLNRGMEDDVLAPLRRWQEGLGVAKERMHALERLRRDVDKQRRAAEKRFKRSEQKLRRAYLGAGYGSSSDSEGSDGYEADRDYVVPRGRLLEDYQRLALHTERHLNAAMESYTDQERLLWEQLSGLVVDAAWLESYAAAAMLKVKETMQSVALALGPSKQPLPAFREAAYAFEGQYGQIGHNTELVKAMGPRARQLASGALPAGAEVLPYTSLRAKRGISTPLMVAAAARGGRQQQALASQPVPPVQVGASSIPIEAVPERLREESIRRVEERAAGQGTRVADVPALPPALAPNQPAGVGALPLAAGTRGARLAAQAAPATPPGAGLPGGVGAGGASQLTASPLTPPQAAASSSAGRGGVGGAALSPATGTAMTAPTTTTTISSSSTGGRVAAGSSHGVVSRAAETAGAAVGTITGAARAAAESFREGVAEGQTGAVGPGGSGSSWVAGSREQQQGFEDGSHTVGAERLPAGTSVTVREAGEAPLPARLAAGSTTAGLSAEGPLAAGAEQEGVVRSSAGYDSVPSTGAVPEGAGSLGTTGGLTGGSHGEQVLPGAVADVNSISPGLRGGTTQPAVQPAAATAASFDFGADDLDSFASYLRPTNTTSTTTPAGLKHHHHHHETPAAAAAAAPAGGFEEPTATAVSSGGGGIMGAVRRAVGA